LDQAFGCRSTSPRRFNSVPHFLHVQPPHIACLKEVGRRVAGTGVPHSGQPPLALILFLMPAEINKTAITPITAPIAPDIILTYRANTRSPSRYLTRVLRIRLIDENPRPFCQGPSNLTSLHETCKLRFPLNASPTDLSFEQWPGLFHCFKTRSKEDQSERPA
jgi:hypothetical protein